MTQRRQDLPRQVRDQLEAARRAAPPDDLLDAVMSEVRAAPQVRVWPAWFRGSLMGVGAAAVLLLVAVLASGPFAANRSPSGSTGASGSPAAGQVAVAEQDGFRLEIRTDRATYTTDEPITISATLTYIGPQDSVTLYHPDPMVTFDLVELAGSRSMGGTVRDVCRPTVVKRDEPIQIPYTKSVAWSGEDPNAAFYQAWIQDPVLHLPAGTWNVLVQGQFRPGDCGQPLDIGTKLTVVVTETEASATPTQSATCKTLDETSYRAIGWLKAKVELVVSRFANCAGSSALVSFDPTTGTFSPAIRLPSDAFVPGMATDGFSVAVPLSGDSGPVAILVVTASGAQHRLDLPPDLGSAGPAQLAALPGGGYLVVGARVLVTVSADGRTVATAPIPAGYVVVAPTSDPDRIVLATVAEAEEAYGLSVRAPFTAYLWPRGAPTPSSIATSIGMVSHASDGSLAHLMAVSGTTTDAWHWLALESSGRVASLGLKGYGDLSPDGTRLETGVDGATDADMRTLVTDASSGTLLATLPGAGWGAAWDGPTLAVVLRPNGAQAGEELAIVSPSGQVRQVPLP